MTAADEAREASETATHEGYNHVGWRRQRDGHAIITALKGLRHAVYVIRCLRLPAQGAGCEVRPRLLTGPRLKEYNSSLSVTSGRIICLPPPPRLPRQTEQKYRKVAFHDPLMGLRHFHAIKHKLLSPIVSDLKKRPQIGPNTNIPAHYSFRQLLAFANSEDYITLFPCIIFYLSSYIIK